MAETERVGLPDRDAIAATNASPAEGAVLTPVWRVLSVVRAVDRRRSSGGERAAAWAGLLDLQAAAGGVSGRDRLWIRHTPRTRRVELS
jgi:hypothetical protein